MTRMRVLRVVPGSIGLEPTIRSFCRQEGYITALSDSALVLARRFAGEDAPVEIRSFGELVRMVLELCGEPSGRIAGSLETQAAIALAAKDLPADSPFAQVAKFAGFHEAVTQVLGELHEWEIDADEMERLAESAPPRLAAKLRGLAQLDRDKDAMLRELGREPHTTQIRNCLECAPERDGALNRLLVLAGTEESPLKARWLRWLAKHGTQITVVCDRHATDAPIFAGVDRMVAHLEVPAEPIGGGTRLSENLFRSKVTPGEPERDTGTSLVIAADALAESEAALRNCVEFPANSAIFVRDLSTYAPLIEASARRLNVPVRLSRRAPLLTNSLIRLTLAALEACAGNDVRRLGALLRSSYLGLTGDQQAQLQSAIKDAHSARELQWETLKLWANLHVEQFPWVTELLEWRRKALGGRFSLREWKPILDELIDHKEMPWHLRREGAAESMAERDRRARNQMQRLLASHISVESLGSEPAYELAQVVTVCRGLLEDADVSIPAEENGVLVTDRVEHLSDASRLHVLGMLEGVFPRRRTEDPILTDEERVAISDLRPEGPRLLSSHDRAAGERDTFYRICASARQNLVFSYPQTDDQRDNIPAFYLSEVARALGAEHLPTHTIPRRELAPEPGFCLAEADRKLRAAMEGPPAAFAEVELSTLLGRLAIKPDNDHGFRPTELRDALQCPFRYTFQHRLRLSARRGTTRWQALRKLPQEAQLVTQPNRERAETALLTALDAQLDSLYSEVDQWEMQLLRSGGQRLIRDWLRREFAARKVWPKEPGSVSANVHFGDASLKDTMPGQVRLEGTVPATSRFRNYNVAHLYQSNPANAKEMTEDEQLLVGLYMLALYQRGHEVAIEFDDVAGKRELVVLTREGGTAHGEAKDGLSVIDLSTSDDPGASRRAFFEEVKKSLRRAMERIQSVRIDPIKGGHCMWCDYGELCRRSQDFGEDLSPFGQDLVIPK